MQLNEPKKSEVNKRYPDAGQSVVTPSLGGRDMDFPLIVFLVSFLVLALAVLGGVRLQSRRPLKETDHQDFNVVLTAVLTLLAMIVGFTFSMAVSRYDLRKARESEEANAIGTEYFRLAMLPKADCEKARDLLKRYTKQRILFYMARMTKLEPINVATAQLGNEMWDAIQPFLAAQPTTALMIGGGVNDVLNSEGYTKAAWLNRIPAEAWVLMILIAAFGNLLMGYNSRGTERKDGRRLLFPFVLALAFLLIADLDSPRQGIIKIHPQNLENVSAFMADPSNVSSGSSAERTDKSENVRHR